MEQEEILKRVQEVFAPHRLRYEQYLKNNEATFKSFHERNQGLLQQEWRKIMSELSQTVAEKEAYHKTQIIVDIASALTGAVAGPEFELKIHKKRG